MEDAILAAVEAAIAKAYPQGSMPAEKIEITSPPNRAMGDFAYPCFQLAKQAKQSPKDVAATLASQVELPASIAQVKPVGPYLNFFVDRGSFVRSECSHILEATSFGANESLRGQTVMVEFSSPNTNKPQHLGHVRNNILGDSLSRILEQCGAKVIRANLVNDRGIHICKTLVAYKRWGNGETPESRNQKGDHYVGDLYVRFEKEFNQEFQDWAQANSIDLKSMPADAKDKLKEEYFRDHSPLGKEAQESLRQWEAGDPQVLELWQTMRQWVIDGFDQTYKEMGVHFDKYYFESETYSLGKDIVEKGLQSGVFTRRDDGAVFIDLTADGLGNKVLMRADGTSVYITQDLGTAVRKQEDFGLSRSVYVVAREQEYHFKVLISILKRLNYPWADGVYHRSYGMVHLTSGRMKSREGTVVDADDLLAELTSLAAQELRNRGETDEGVIERKAKPVGLAALKYYLLAVDPIRDITYKPEESIAFEGRTGPYIQYAHARICSILRKADEAGEVSALPEKVEVTDEELGLLLTLRSFPNVVEVAGDAYDPSRVAFYLYDLAKQFSQFYNTHPVLKAEPESRQLRLALCAATAKVIGNGLAMLGIEAPEEM